MAANTKKTIKIEEIRAEQLKKAIKEIDTLSDPYQKVKSRLMLVQAINGIGQVSVEDIPEGREALENNKKKTSNKSSNKAKETVEKVKEAVQQVEENYSEENTEVVQEEVTPNVTEAPEPEVQPTQAEEVAGPILIQLDTGEGVVEYDVTDSYLKLTEVPDDENKQLLAYYLMAYDANDIAAITEAFSQQITSDPYELLNADNYIAFLEYFNTCLQG